MTLSERLNARSSLAKTILGVYGLNVHCTTNLRFCLKPLLYGHKLGMETGEVRVSVQWEGEPSRRAIEKSRHVQTYTS